MDWPDYLRDQAAMYRKLAEEADDPVVKTELLLELASVCEKVAIISRLTGGKDRSHGSISVALADVRFCSHSGLKLGSRHVRKVPP